MFAKVQNHLNNNQNLNNGLFQYQEAVLDYPNNNGKSVEIFEPQESEQKLVSFTVDAHTKWSWSCRKLDPQKSYWLNRATVLKPRAGDVVVARVEAVRNHTRIMTAGHERLRLYPGDIVVGVFGNRYATDAFEGKVNDVDELHMLTNAGMIGTVCAKHENIKPPTRLSFLGYLTDEMGQRLNLKTLQFRRIALNPPPQNIILVVGTGMNSGKTTATTKLVKALVNKGLRVAACKFTGSVSNGDLYELRATGAQDVRDFSDYGFPSTYLCPLEELSDLFYTMMSDAAQVNPDVTVVEVADGLLQRETKMILSNANIRQHVSGVILAAPCVLSTLQGIEQIDRYGHTVAGVSGIITNSPLFMRELAQQNSNIRVGGSTDTGDELAQLLIDYLQEVS